MDTNYEIPKLKDVRDYCYVWHVYSIVQVNPPQSLMTISFFTTDKWVSMLYSIHTAQLLHGEHGGSYCCVPSWLQYDVTKYCAFRTRRYSIEVLQLCIKLTGFECNYYVFTMEWSSYVATEQNQNQVMFLGFDISAPVIEQDISLEGGLLEAAEIAELQKPIIEPPVLISLTYPDKMLDVICACTVYHF